MDIQRKIEILGESAQHDVCIACGTHANRRVDDIGRWIYPAVLPDGRRINQLKVLQTNACRNDCYYCAQRVGRDSQRTAFTPDELAAAFDKLYRKGLVRGLFLSSAIAGSAESSMDRMLATVELLRRRYRFPGYIHLKILPGVTMAHVEQAVRLALRSGHLSPGDTVVITAGLPLHVPGTTNAIKVIKAPEAGRPARPLDR